MANRERYSGRQDRDHDDDRARGYGQSEGYQGDYGRGGQGADYGGGHERDYGGDNRGGGGMGRGYQGSRDAGGYGRSTGDFDRDYQAGRAQERYGQSDISGDYGQDYGYPTGGARSGRGYDGGYAEDGQQSYGRGNYGQATNYGGETPSYGGDYTGRGGASGAGYGGAGGYGGSAAGYGSSNYGSGGYGSSGYGSGGYGNPDQRDWAERAGDEVRSWFGDEEAARRREADHSGRGPKNYTRSDDRIREDVCDRLTHDAMVDASEIEVSVDGREVTLNGKVDSRAAKRRAEDCADSVSSVGHVQNNLRVAEQAARSGGYAGTTTTTGSTTGSATAASGKARTQSSKSNA